MFKEYMRESNEVPASPQQLISDVRALLANWYSILDLSPADYKWISCTEIRNVLNNAWVYKN